MQSCLPSLSYLQMCTAKLLLDTVTLCVLVWGRYSHNGNTSPSSISVFLILCLKILSSSRGYLSFILRTATTAALLQSPFLSLQLQCVTTITARSRFANLKQNEPHPRICNAMGGVNCLTTPIN